jgi:hypothetical protein
MESLPPVFISPRQSVFSQWRSGEIGLLEELVAAAARPGEEP